MNKISIFIKEIKTKIFTFSVYQDKIISNIYF